MTATTELASLVATHTPLGEAVCAHLRQAAARLGVDPDAMPRWAKTVFHTQADPYSGEVSLIGTWRDGHRYGTITCFPDHRAYAEYQLLVLHPEQPEQFVEAISVWGNADKLKSEPVLLAMPD